MRASSGRLRERLVQLVWDQWAQMGVFAETARRDGWAADPEALVVLTLEVGREEARLFDEVLDWLVLNGPWVSVQRLHNLVPPQHPQRGLLDATLTWCAAHNPRLRWAMTPPREAPREPARLFRRAAGRPREPDPTFLRFGYLRPRARRSHKSERPDLRAPINFALRLRRLFGRGTRGEVLRILLTSPEDVLSIHELADRSLYSRRNMAEALEGFADSGAVRVRSRAGERVFRVPREPWTEALGIRTRPTFVHWPALTRFLLGVWEWMEPPQPARASAYLRASEARRLVHERARDMASAGIEAPDDRAHPGEEYLPAFEEMLDGLLRDLAAGRAPSTPGP